MSPEPHNSSDVHCSPSNDQIDHITNKGKGDTWQIMVSTADDGILRGENNGDGVSRQLGGKYDKNTVLQLSKDMLSFGVPATDNNGKATRSYPPSVSGPAQGHEASSTTTRRHGTGNVCTLATLNGTQAAPTRKSA